MFSLVVTIISIALVGALALATLYYGGGAFTQGRAAAEAAKLTNQQQQLQAADLLFRTTMGRAPTDLSELVSSEFLKSIPTAKATALTTALAQSQAWTMPMPAQAVFLMHSVDPEVCAEYNKTAYGVNGVLNLARATMTSQCYGAGSEMTVVSARTRIALTTVAAADTPGLPSADLTTDPIPTALDDAAWEVQPTLLATDTAEGGTTEENEPPVSPPTLSLALTENGSLLYTYVGFVYPRTVTVTNSGPGPAVFSGSPSVTHTMLQARFGPALPAGAVTVVNNTCTGTLNAGSSCTLGVSVETAYHQTGKTLTLTVPVQGLEPEATTQVFTAEAGSIQVGGNSFVLPPATVGVPYSVNFRDYFTVKNSTSLTAQNVPLVLSVSPPSGWTFDAVSGVLSGVPSAAGYRTHVVYFGSSTAGNLNFNLTTVAPED